MFQFSPSLTPIHKAIGFSFHAHIWAGCLILISCILSVNTNIQTQMKRTNIYAHLIFDLHLKHTSFPLYNNQTVFSGYFPHLVWQRRLWIVLYFMQTWKLSAWAAEHLTNILFSLQQSDVKSLKSKRCLFKKIIIITIKQCYLTTRFTTISPRCSKRKKKGQVLYQTKRSKLDYERKYWTYFLWCPAHMDSSKEWQDLKQHQAKLQGNIRIFFLYIYNLQFMSEMKSK